MVLSSENTSLVIIDIQGNLAQSMHDKISLFENLKKIIKGAQILELPIIVTEQVPEKLGPTIPEIANLFPNFNPLPKVNFSCCAEPEFIKKINSVGKPQILLAGIEAHVCVYQTAVDLINIGYEVHLLTDCISSRTAENKTLAIERMKTEGVRLTSVEMALFELLKWAKGKQFREIITLIKSK